MRYIRLDALAQRVGVALAVALCSAAPVYTQSTPSLSGNWVWKAPARRNKPQVQFTLSIHRRGEAVSGVYSVDEFINGKWQGEDGNQTPFRGKVQGNTIQIEFDHQATVPGYQELVTYSAPTDGRKPSAAVLTLSGPTLLWRLSRSPGIDGVPAQVALRRQRRK
jgi:hypothetical protein